jgi:hypothetical protein
VNSPEPDFGAANPTLRASGAVPARDGRQQYKEIDDLRRRMVEASVDAHNRIDALLTEEQKEKVREWRRGPHWMMRAN